MDRVHNSVYTPMSDEKGSAVSGSRRSAARGLVHNTCALTRFQNEFLRSALAPGGRSTLHGEKNGPSGHESGEPVVMRFAVLRQRNRISRLRLQEQRLLRCGDFL